MDGWPHLRRVYLLRWEPFTATLSTSSTSTSLAALSIASTTWLATAYSALSRGASSATWSARRSVTLAADRAAVACTAAGASTSCT
eukprot:4262331-Prymnesium_polylepis.1